MRSAMSQYKSIMVRAGALQQPPEPHVSHAENYCGVLEVLQALALRALENFQVGSPHFKSMVELKREGCSRFNAVARQDGQRCALLTTKSRNTWTRATVFNSSG